MIVTTPESGHPPPPAESEGPIPTVAPIEAAGPAESSAPPGDPGTHHAGERSAWSLVWLGVTVAGIDLWGSWSGWALAGLVAPLLVLAGIVGLTASWLVRDPRSRVMQVSALGLVLVSTAAGQGVNIHSRVFYSTDSAAFDQVAARFLLHGIDPYTASMSSAAQLLKTPSQYWTYMVGGGHVTQVSYPAGSFLFEVAGMALGFHHEIVDWVDLFAWMVTGVLIFALVPASIRWFAGLVLLVAPFTGVFGSGGTDAVFLPFLVLAVWRWDRFGLGPEAGLARWIGPVALGLACSIKQTPWFCIPFLALGLYLEARGSDRSPGRVVAAYLAVVAGVFAVVNLPFIIWQPTDWARGVVLPFHEPLVADGQGLVTLALHGVARGVSLPLLTAAGLLVLVALLAAFVVWYPQAKRVWLLIVPLTFFVASRSLSTYLVDLYPAAVVAAASVAAARRTAVDPAPGRLRVPLTVVAVLSTLAAAAVSVLAFVSPPLQLAVRSVSTSHAATSLDSVTVAVRNVTDETITPHFMVTVGGGHPAGFWRPARSGQLVLGPHGSATVTLRPVSYFGAPAHGTHWLVEAYSSSPEALSTSPLQFWQLGRAQ